MLDEWNLKLWDAARDGDNDAVLAAISIGGDVNWNNDSYVSDIDNSIFVTMIMIISLINTNIQDLATKMLNSTWAC
jgi:hypothetical protein